MSLARYVGSSVLALAAAAAGACAAPEAVLTQQLEARRLSADLHVHFTRAADAASRAVMADTDDASVAAADEARAARAVVDRDVAALRPVLESLGYAEDLQHLDAFNARYQQYRRLDDEVLTLAVENTNLKAERLSFGPSRVAADAFRSSLAAAASGAGDRCRAELLASRAVTALLDIQVLHGPHIAEPDDRAMTRMEAQMEAAAAAARQALEELKPALPRGGAQLADAAAALDRFMSVHEEIVALSRRNTNVRSLALSLGRKRTLTAECEDRLRALDETLTKHRFTATR